MSLSYTVEPAEPSELAFVLSSWKRSYREACCDVRTDTYYAAQSAICDEILSRFPLLLVARNPDGVCLGWICAEASDTALTVHYVNVKSPYRRQGVMKALLAATIEALPDAGEANFYTHKTRRAHVFDKLGFSFVPVGRYLRGAV